MKKMFDKLQMPKRRSEKDDADFALVLGGDEPESSEESDQMSDETDAAESAEPSDVEAKFQDVSDEDLMAEVKRRGLEAQMNSSPEKSESESY